ncbi:MAG TPA: SCO1664 family protein [Nocardioidaceae bacterium]|nr:SCO1664 family protein [Nocardioidaceae bacterium]
MSPSQRLQAHHGLTPDDELTILRDGELEVRGRILPASNVTLVATATLGSRSLECVYKPISGERPLWDFPNGSLAAREVAAYAVSEALGWAVVPLTLDRAGPLGPGMVQVWREPVDGQEPVDVVPEGEIPEGYLHVLDAADGEGNPVSLVHENTPTLRRMAVFDAVVNNADRKGGHVLAMAGGHRYGVDHGVCFHVHPKLRTVLWGWATLPLHEDERAALGRLADALADPDGGLRAELDRLLDPDEVTALEARCEDLIAHSRMPLPSGEWPAIPWPAF